MGLSCYLSSMRPSWGVSSMAVGEDSLTASFSDNQSDIGIVFQCRKGGAFCPVCDFEMLIDQASRSSLGALDFPLA